MELLIRHCENVKNNCEILGEKLIVEDKMEDFGVQLIANGRIHDYSKFVGIEFQYLTTESKEKTPELFKLALDQHNKINLHHPEAWSGGIKEMPDLYIAEMTADWLARSAEFGNDFFEWVKDKATDKFKFVSSGRIYKTIKKYAEMILTPKFK